MPVGHCVQAAPPGEAEPAGHTAHWLMTDAPGGDEKPGPQAPGGATPPGQNMPGGHCTELVVLPSGQ